MMEEPLDLRTEIAFMSREERKEENKSEGEKAMNLFSPGRERKKKRADLPTISMSLLSSISSGGDNLHAR